MATTTAVHTNFSWSMILSHKYSMTSSLYVLAVCTRWNATTTTELHVCNIRWSSLVSSEAQLFHGGRWLACRTWWKPHRHPWWVSAHPSILWRHGKSISITCFRMMYDVFHYCTYVSVHREPVTIRIWDIVRNDEKRLLNVSVDVGSSRQ